MSDTVFPPNSETMYKDSPSSTVRDFAVITPNDSTEFDPYPRAIRIGVGGDVTVTTIRDVDILFSNVQDGETLPVWVKKVKATATTATGIVGYFG